MMNISRLFMIIGTLYLLGGIGFGMYMSGSQDTTMIPIHAHMNLLGFTLMMVFGLTYRLIPAMAGSMLAMAHFWLHQIGAVVLLVMLYLLLSGRIAETAMVPVAPIAEVAVWIGIACFGVNLLQNAK